MLCVGRVFRKANHYGKPRRPAYLVHCVYDSSGGARVVFPDSVYSQIRQRVHPESLPESDKNHCDSELGIASFCVGKNEHRKARNHQNYSRKKRLVVAVLFHELRNFYRAPKRVYRKRKESEPALE